MKSFVRWVVYWLITGTILYLMYDDAMAHPYAFGFIASAAGEQLTQMAYGGARLVRGWFPSARLARGWFL